MSKRILIEAVHPEEVRVVVTENSRLQDFDFESAAKKQIKGNIYLAKVSRVEPSLQAAFVEYGGNKQGFLPFAEIHPDYYQVPSADKPEDEMPEAAVEGAAASSENSEDYEHTEREPHERFNDEEGENQEIDVLDDETYEDGGKSNLYRKYKIQEVIKRNQVLLVQVIKEERGNKGASLTTYISLAGRYCVLMPNSERQGGVSRRIADGEDRRRLKTLVDSFSLPEGTSLIVRTAGLNSEKGDIERDYEYLSTLWEHIKKQTLSSKAPALIHEEGDLIKRTMRDLYDNSIDEIIVEGEKAFNTARDFMTALAPGHSSKVKLYNDNIPIFWKYQIESEIAELYDNKAYLKSGGYIVINSTEALVAIDVNSGRSTRERNVEETATKTNLEAAYEIARQLRLRDLAGLIVIDFIDMMDSKNRRIVERALKDALSYDRAKIQVGRISPFGLLEMSRQRLRSSFIEASMVECVHCNGTGVVRSPESTVVGILRAIDSEAAKRRGEMRVITPTEVSYYLLNKKRDDIVAIEKRHGVKIMIERDKNLTGQNFTIEAGGGEKGQKFRTDGSGERPRDEYRRSGSRKGQSASEIVEKLEESDSSRESSSGSNYGGNITSVETDTSRSRNRRGRRRSGGGSGGGRGKFNDNYSGGDRDKNRDRSGGSGRDRDNREGRDRDNRNDRDRFSSNNRKRHGAGGGRGGDNRQGGQNRGGGGGGEKKSVLKKIWKKIVE